MRTILGPALLAFSILHAEPAAVDAQGVPVSATPVVAKVDPIPELSGVDTEAEPLAVRFNLPAYDLATSNKLVTITVVVVPKGHGEPSDVEGWLGSSYPKGSLDVSANQSGGAIAVEVPGLPDGEFVGQVLFTFDE